MDFALVAELWDASLVLLSRLLQVPPPPRYSVIKEAVEQGPLPPDLSAADVKATRTATAAASTAGAGTAGAGTAGIGTAGEEGGRAATHGRGFPPSHTVPLREEVRRLNSLDALLHAEATDVSFADTFCTSWPFLAPCFMKIFAAPHFSLTCAMMIHIFYL